MVGQFVLSNGRPSAWVARVAAVGLVCAITEASHSQPAPAGPPPAAAAAVQGVPYTTTITVDGADAEVQTIAENTSSLKTLEKDTPPGAPGIVGRAKADIARIAQALSATGRYDAVVDVTVAGVSVSPQSAADAAQRARRPVPVVIRITPGPIFTFGVVRIRSLDRGATAIAEIDPAKVGLKPGEPAPSAAIFSAEGKIVDKLRANGYPFAAVKGRDVLADHTKKQLDVTINVAAGDYTPFGEVTVTGTRDVNPEVVRGRVPFEPGEKYDPEKIQELREEVAKLDVFSSIRIREGTKPDANGRLPVAIEVEEKKFRYVGAAAKYDSVDGAGVDVYWGHRNLFGGAEKLRLEAKVGRLIVNPPKEYEYDFKANFEKPGIWTGFDDLLIEAEAMRLRPDAYWMDGARGQIGIRRRLSSELSIQGGFELEASKIRDTFGEKKYLLYGVPLGLTFDSTDNKLDPSTGIRALVSAEPMYNKKGDTKTLNIFKGQVSSYFAFDEDHRFILAGKVGLGSIVGPKDLEDVPANRRFFAGGGGSIRGFGYQSASPYCEPIIPRPDKALKCKKDTPIGGRSLLETSVEARIKITDTIGVVPFVDAGAAFDQTYPDFSENIRVGAGIGLRYYTAIGPIRFDVATPVVGKTKNDSRVAFYVSIGQAF